MTDLRTARLIVAGVLVALGCLVGAGPAAAHDDLIGSTPEDGAVVATSPGTIVLEFFEPIGEVDPSLVLQDDQDEVVETLDPMIDDRTMTGVLPSDLSDGTYAVVWSIGSDDGHPVEGTTRFAIGAPTTSMDYSGDGVSASSPDLPASTTWIWVAVAGGAALVGFVVVLLRRRAHGSAA